MRCKAGLGRMLIIRFVSFTETPNGHCYEQHRNGVFRHLITSLLYNYKFGPLILPNRFRESFVIDRWRGLEANSTGYKTG